MPIVVLRTSVSFLRRTTWRMRSSNQMKIPKRNEFLFRRLTVEDAAEAHVAALERAPALGFAQFIISAPTPFQPTDCAELIVDAPSVVARYFPNIVAIYARRGLVDVPVYRPRLFVEARGRAAWIPLSHGVCGDSRRAS